MSSEQLSAETFQTCTHRGGKRILFFDHALSMVFVYLGQVIFESAAADLEHDMSGNRFGLFCYCGRAGGVGVE